MRKNILGVILLTLFLIFSAYAQYGMDVEIQVPGMGQGGVRVEVTGPENLIAEVVGVYQGVHPDWRERVFIYPDGTYRRANGEPGVWSFDGTFLILDWTNWGVATLRRQSDGSFFDSRQRFRLTWVAGPEALPARTPAPTTQRSQTPPLPESRHFRLGQSTFRVGQSIEVQYHSMPTGNMEWITFVRKGEPDNTWGNWTYTDGSQGTFIIQSRDIPGPGEYEMRAYYGGAGDYTVKDRITITVTR